MGFLGGSSLAMLLVGAAILCWSGANICWDMAGKSKDQQTESRKLVYLVGGLMLLLLLAPLASGPEPFAVSVAILGATPVLWLGTYFLAKRHKEFWEKKLTRLIEKLPKRRNSNKSN